MSVGVRIAPRVPLFEPVGGAARTDPFLSLFGIQGDPVNEFFEDTPGAKVDAALSEQAQKASADLYQKSLELGAGISRLFGFRPTPTEGGDAPEPSDGGGDGGTVGGDAFRKPERKIKGSDFRTPAKIAATAGAVGGAAFVANEALKGLGQTANDALDTTGKAIENAADGIGKGFENVGQSIGDALSPILDPLGITDPETQASIGKWLVIAGAVGIGLLALWMVLSKK